MANLASLSFNRKKIIIWSIAILSLMAIIFAYWQYQKTHPSTNDAYVGANIVNIAAQVSGPVSQINVENNQIVKKGQLLFTIVPKHFQIEIYKAKAQLKLTEQRINVLKKGVQTAAEKVKQAQAQLQVAEQNVPRTLALAKKGGLAKAKGVEAQGELDSTKAGFAAATNEWQEAKEKLGALGNNNAEIQQAKATLAQATLNLQHTKVFAPAAGTLVNFSLRPGTIVNANTPLFALIEQGQWWVDANFKETDLENIRLGQKATIEVDLYPNQQFTGYVRSISAGSGAAFALLPPENATGNWVKVTQRFSVKIMITNTKPKYPLRVGASSTVTLYTNSTPKT